MMGSCSPSQLLVLTSALDPYTVPAAEPDRREGGLWDPPFLVKGTAILAQWSVKTHQPCWTDSAVE